MTDEKETRLDQFKTSLKNHPLAIPLFLIIGLGSFLTALGVISDSVHSLGVDQAYDALKNEVLNVCCAQGKVVTLAGIEVASGDATLTDDRKTINAGVRITNRNAADVLVMAVGAESAFVLPDMPNRAPIDVSGIADCRGNSGSLPTTSLCRNDADSRWSKLNPGAPYPVTLIPKPDEFDSHDSIFWQIMIQHGERRFRHGNSSYHPWRLYGR